MKKGNKIENWDASYNDLSVTYSEEIDTPSRFANRLIAEIVHEDLKECFPNNKNLKILEVGCGGARTSLYLAKRGYDVTCMDYAPEAVALAERNFSAFNVKGNILQGDLYDLKLPVNSFDCVMSFGLLEHFEDLAPIIKNTGTMLKPGGVHIHCIITKKFSTQTIVDAVYFPIKLLRDIITKRQFDVKKSFRDFPHYENSYTWNEYNDFFTKQGNTIIKNEPFATVFPFIALPFGFGELILKYFSKFLVKFYKKSNRTGSKFLHIFSPAIYLVAVKR